MVIQQDIVALVAAPPEGLTGKQSIERANRNDQQERSVAVKCSEHRALFVEQVNQRVERRETADFSFVP